MNSADVVWSLGDTLPPWALFSEGAGITDNVPFATLLITLTPKGINDRNTDMKFRLNVPVNHSKVYAHSFLDK